MSDAKPIAAERMRRHRERRRAGYLSIPVEVGKKDIAGLIRRRHLDPALVLDRDAVRAALHAWFDKTIAAG